ncbi:MAG: hypothetical protein VYE15_07335 [Myxococcota bacterium]|nr:hypothetical protein [Myxococcota bacterium]
MRDLRTPKAVLALAFVTGLSASCTELLEAAGTITFGNPDIPLLEMTKDNGQALTWPSVGSLVGLSESELEAIPGMPSTLDNGTFAHLQGALRITGECFMDVSAADLGEEMADLEGIEDFRIQITSCSAEDSRCSDRCFVEGQEEQFRGMIFSTAVTLEILNEESAAALQEQLEQSPVTGEAAADAIVQIRMQFYKLRLYQQITEDEEKVLNDFIEGFGLYLSEPDGTNEVLIVDDASLYTIREESPQRYDVASSSEFTKGLKKQILMAQPTSITVRQEMRIPQPSLYEVSLEGGGLEIKVQPEIVISALSVGKSLVASKTGGE